MQRKEEILAKKAKLAELRRQREEREARQKGHGNNRESLLSGEDSSLKAPSPRRTTDRAELDSFIETLVGDRPGSRGQSGTGSPAGRKSRPSSTLSAVQIGSETYEQGDSVREKVETTSAGTQTLSTGPVETTFEQAPEVTKAEKPGYVTYNKGVQTSEFWSPRKPRKSRTSFSDGEEDVVQPLSGSPKSSKRLSRLQRERADTLRDNLRKEIEEEVKAAQNPTTNGAGPSTTLNYPARALTDEELNAVTSSEEFLTFVDRSSKIIEKALDEDYDVLADYAQEGLEIDEDEEEGYASVRGKKGRRLKQTVQFYDERWCRKRMISDLGFSPKVQSPVPFLLPNYKLTILPSQFSELLLASYTKNATAPNDPAGLLQIWNLHLQSRPEYTFHSTSDVLTARFSPFHPSLILGGTYTGQVLLWDTRARSSPNPVLKTPLTGASSGGHTHPIYALALVGTQNANNIISCSTDGVVCGWTTDMLTVPQEYLELSTPPPSKTDDLAPTCMAFPEADPTSFLVGTEEGTIYPCHRYDRAGAKAGVDAKLKYKSHTAPVMSLDFHGARGPVDLGDLVLSTGLDWSIKVWKTKPASSSAVRTAQPSSSTAHPSSSAASSGATATATTQPDDHPPLLSISREDLVYDARWHPLRPGVFASVDGGGGLEVWDLSLDTEVPVAREVPTVDHMKGGLEGYVAKGLNRVRWDEGEGRRVVVGGGSGVVSVFEVGAGLSGEGGGEEWGAVRRVVEGDGR